MQRHLWAQNDCYYTFLLLLLLSKPMSSPGGVERPTEGNGTSQQSRKRRQPKNVPGIRRTAPQWGVTPAYTYTLCMCVCVCCVQKFMFCLFICLCSALWTVLDSPSLWPYFYTPARTHTHARVAVAHANLYTCPDAIINIRQKYLISAPFVYLLFAGLSRVGIITARSAVIYTKCISFIATTNPHP